MNPPPSIEPPQPAPPRDREPLWLFLSLLGAMGVIALASKLDLPLPQCGWRRLTGIPCPFCGGTRSLLAWTQLDLVQAVVLNPLVFVATLLAVGWFAIWIITRLRRQDHALPSMTGWLLTRPGVWFAIGAVALNWFYLILGRS